MKEDTQKHKVTIVFAPDVYQEMKGYAEKHERSFNGEIMWALREYIAQQKKEELRMQTTVADVLQGLPLPAMKEELRSRDMLYQTEAPYATIQCIDLGTYRYSIDGQPNRYIEGFQELLKVVPPKSCWTADTHAVLLLIQMRNLNERRSDNPFVQNIYDTMRKSFYEKDLPCIKEIGYQQWDEERKEQQVQEMASRFEGGTLVDKDGAVCATLTPATDYSSGSSFSPTDFCEVAVIEWIRWDGNDEDEEEVDESKIPTTVWHDEENSYSIRSEDDTEADFELKYGQCRSDIRWLSSMHPSATTLVLKGEENPLAIKVADRALEIMKKETDADIEQLIKGFRFDD